MVTALTAGSFSNMSFNDVIMDNIQEQASERYNEKLNVINTLYESKLDTLDGNSDKWINVSAQVTNAKMAMENGLEGIEEIKEKLIDMKVALAGAKNTDSKAYYVECYNEYLNDINTAANAYGPAYNPIGRINEATWEANTIEYRDNLSNGYSFQMEGMNLGTTFRINSDDGTTWLYDADAQAIKQRKGYDAVEGSLGVETGKESSTLSGLSLVSYDETTGEIELTARVEGTERTITGTLEKNGLGLMGAWFYNDLETEEDYNRAMADLQQADFDVLIGETTISGYASTVANSEAKVDKELESLRDDKKEVLQEQMAEQQKLQVEVQQQYQAMVTNLENMRSQQANYVSIFGSALSNDPMLDILV